MPAEIFTVCFESPLGFVRVHATERGIRDIAFVEEMEKSTPERPEFLTDCVTQLREYFEGRRHTFDTLPLLMEGTEFQQNVWDITAAVPYGKTITYGAIAKELKMNGGGQAVGSAMGRNPLCIIVPCHRVVPTSPEGSVGGYAGGAWRKEWLLNHEKKISNAQ
jgi:methylated-DNA-[protein]-cysteine S-methyltransferase